MHTSIYLDHSATTALDKRVLDAMLPYYTDHYGNAASSHYYGRKAEQAIEDARESIAQILNCKAKEIVFTSGGTESNNLAIRGAAWSKHNAGQGHHLITSAIEHEATSNTLNQLSTFMSFKRQIVSTDSDGIISQNSLDSAIQEDSTLFSCAYANNEVGTIQIVSDLAPVCHSHNMLFHIDAVQAAGQLSVDTQELDIDLMSLSAHKFYGPKGVGVLYARQGSDILPAQTGGSHEEGKRAGTQNTALIVGMATALNIAYSELEAHTGHYRRLRDQLIEGILDRIPSARLTGHPTQRLPSHASFVFDGIESNTLLMHLDMNGIAASSGSACKTGSPEPSTVLLALGFSESEARSGLRLTVGRENTDDDISYTIETLTQIVEKLHRLTPV